MVPPAALEGRLAVLLVGRLRELVGKLFLDTGTERIGHLENVIMAVVVCLDLGSPILVQSRHHRIGEQIQMGLHHLLEVSLLPVRVGSAQERRNALAVGAPLLSVSYTHLTLPTSDL